MPDIPQEAVKAATEAIEAAAVEFGDGGEVYGQPGDFARAALEAAAPVLERLIRDRIAADLRRAASGQREYAAADGQDEDASPLDLRATCYESAAGIAADPRNLLDVIPSWRWTAEESASVRSNPPEVPDA
jgi:hypothetical protein